MAQVKKVKAQLSEIDQVKAVRRSMGPKYKGWLMIVRIGKNYYVGSSLKPTTFDRAYKRAESKIAAGGKAVVMEKD